ncbi:geranylgeranyl transferase type-1 subunit beta [Dimargaris xerosporica]|nr:geranylgeranyl transferase type-1 subunit beta [Dimargaris xerosporica]
MATPGIATELLVKRHVQYFKRCLDLLPHPYQKEEAVRATFGYFCLSGLDLLGTLHTTISDDKRRQYVEWLYAQQITQQETTVPGTAGFRGGPFMGPIQPEPDRSAHYLTANLATTYSALLALVILGDDLSRVDRQGILQTLAALQQSDGNFVPHPYSTERDMRFVYCACAISFILDDWSGVNQDLVLAYIRACHCYDGGISQEPSQESHGGSTYCAVASLQLMNQLPTGLVDTHRTLQWCLQLQSQGFHGRINKPDDTCYAFWVGATIKILGHYDLVNHEKQRQFLWATQRHIGGFGKLPGEFPAFALMDDPNVQALVPELNLSRSSYERLQHIIRSQRMVHKQ